MENENKSDNLNEIYEITTKSPGKVLMCGGYLIINPKYRGLVICTKTYFESKGRLEILQKVENHEIQTTLLIQINSKNFNQSLYYKVDISFKNSQKENLDLLINFERLDTNDFIEILSRKFEVIKDLNKKDDKINDNFIINSIKSAIYYLLLNKSKALDFNEFSDKLKNKIMYMIIDIEADYRFYGHDKNLEQTNIANNIKTGLGSSSALVCSLTSNIILNLFQYFDNIEIKSSFNEYENKIKLCILLASINANNQAQNKVDITFFKWV